MIAIANTPSLKASTRFFSQWCTAGSSTAQLIRFSVRPSVHCGPQRMSDGAALPKNSSNRCVVPIFGSLTMKKFHVVRMLLAVTSLTAIVVDLGAGHKFFGA